MRSLYSTYKSNVKKLPLYLLLSDDCHDVFDELISASQSPDQHNDMKIDFNYVDSDGLTLLHKAIVLKQTKLVKLFLNKNCFNLEKKMLNKNEPYYNENILQMTIRFKMFDIYDLVLQKLSTDYHKNFLIIIKQDNINSQNILHLICSLLSLDERSLHFGIERIKHLFGLIGQKSGNSDTTCIKLMQSSDKYKRTPLHWAMMNRAYSLNNNPININDFDYYLIDNWSDLCAKDNLNRYPLHYLLCNFIKLGNPTRLTYNEHFDQDDQYIDPINILIHYTNKLRNTNQIRIIDDQDMYGYTVLHYAVIRNSLISVAYLIENFNCSFYQNKKTILGLSVCVFRLAFLSFLRSKNCCPHLSDYFVSADPIGCRNHLSSEFPGV
jgi:ankyrin repeat protein